MRTPEVPLEDEHSFANYELPPLSLLEEPEVFPVEEHDQKLRQRASLLAVLAPGLSLDDEEFLETALDDRAGEVREVARQLLSRLPGSAFRRR